MDYDSVTPVCEQCRTGCGPIGYHSDARVAIRRDSGLGQFDVVFPGHASIWNLIVVVGTDIVVTPRRSITGGVSCAH